MKKIFLIRKTDLTVICIVFFLLISVIPLVARKSRGAGGNRATGTTYYVDFTTGDDNNNGSSPFSAWKTISRVNNQEFNPGDSVLLKRGEMWRERLFVTHSGISSHPITFGAYGTGAKPLLLGSVEMNDAADWLNEGSNIWSTVTPKDGQELLINPSFDQNTTGWVLSVGGSANASLTRDTLIYDSAPASGRIDCVNNGQGDPNSWLFIFSQGLPIVKGEWYAFSIKAKASTAFDLYTINLLKSGTPENYFSSKSKPIPGFFQVTTDWQTFTVYFLANSTANDGQLLIDFINLPNGESINIDTLSFQKCTKQPLFADVGSIIFDNEASVGEKVNYKEDLAAQGEFWFDYYAGELKMYSTSNPATIYSDIECALGAFRYRDIWNAGAIVYIDADDITIENLDLRYGGADGIWGEEVNNVIIKDCDISYCGGTYGEGIIRMGNGVTFWEETHNCSVEGCKIHEIYDAALSNQGEETNIQSSIYYLNNLIWNSEYSFEIWNKPESSAMNDIYVENNTCLGAGFGWSHKQRPDPHGWHLALWGNWGSTDNIIICHNVFYEAAFSALYYDMSEREYHVLLDYNYYYQASGYLMAFKYGIPYTMENFSSYQQNKNQDLHSVTGNKEMVQEAARDLVPAEDVSFLNELFNRTDALEPTKNEGVTLDGAEFAITLPPPSFTDLEESDDDGNYTISWTSVLEATTYVLEEDDNPTFTSPIAIYSGNETSYHVSGKDDGVYYYRVKAVNAYLDGEWSNIISITVEITDKDGDGLPDSWELEHFGNLDQNAADDYDGDGYSNLQEYQENTDPTDKEDYPGAKKSFLSQYWWIFIILLVVVIAPIVGILWRKRTRTKIEHQSENDKEPASEREF